MTFFPNGDPEISGQKVDSGAGKFSGLRQSVTTSQFPQGVFVSEAAPSQQGWDEAIPCPCGIKVVF